MDNLSIHLKYSQIFYYLAYIFRRFSLRHLLTKIFRLLSPESFGIETNRPLESSNESTATPCPLIFDQTHQDS